MRTRNSPKTALEACSDSPTLARLTALSAESMHYLNLIQVLIPEKMRCLIQAGPIDNGIWCLIIKNAGAAAKIKNLAPIILTTLKENGCNVSQLRIKVEN